jgi:hypothetical protein
MVMDLACLANKNKNNKIVDYTTTYNSKRGRQQQLLCTKFNYKEKARGIQF